MVIIRLLREEIAMRIIKLLTVVTVALLGMLFSSVAWSSIELTPRFSLSQEYNDNISLRETNREIDWITTVEPGLILDYSQRSIDLSLDYSLRYRFYRDNTSEDQDRFREVQRATANLLFFSGRPFTLLTTGTISRETLSERDRDLEFNDTVQRSTVYRLSIMPEYRLRLGPKTSAVVGYSLNLVDYVDRGGNDYIEHQGRATLNQHLTANLDIWARYQYTDHDNDNNLEDFDRHDASVGGTYRPGARTTLTASVGRTWIDYDFGDETTSTVWATDISYRLSEALQATLAYSQDFSMTAVDGLSRTREGSFTLIYQPPMASARTILFWRELDYQRLIRIDESYGVRLIIDRKIGRSLTAGMDAGYERIENKDPNPVTNENIHRYTLGGSLGYVYRRFNTTLSYRHRFNDSDLFGRDYRNNIVTLKGTLRF